MDRINRKRINWFFKFLNADLKKMSVQEYIAMSAEWSIQICKRQKQDQDFNKCDYDEIIELTDGIVMGNLDALQRQLRSKTDPLFKELAARKSHPQVLNKESAFGPDQSDFTYFNVMKEKIETSISISLLIEIGGGPESTTIQVNEWSENQEVELITSFFLRELDGIPLSAFKNCLECGGWTIQLGKKDKNYCSIRCLNRHKQRERREKLKIQNPKEYEEEKRKKAKRERLRYEKKVAEEHGPIIKPKRRPYKYKEEE